MSVRVFASLLLVACVSSACVSVDLPFGQRPPLEEATVLGSDGPKIAMIDVSGPIAMAGSSGPFGLGGNEAMPARIRQELALAAADPEVAAVLLRIDSPGGTVIASEVIYGELLRFKEKTGRPVIAQMMGMATSGGYYVAMAADHVQAYTGTITGSIGVILVDLNLSGLMDKIGVADETLTSGNFKDAGSPFRPARPEERAQLRSVILDMYETFVGVVDRGRPALDEAAVRALADGRVYSAKQARANGLVDSIGDLDSAVERVREAAGVSGPSRVVVYHRGGAPPENLFSAAPPAAPQPLMRNWLDALPPSGFLYLWSPGLRTIEP